MHYGVRRLLSTITSLPASIQISNRERLSSSAWLWCKEPSWALSDLLPQQKLIRSSAAWLSALFFHPHHLSPILPSSLASPPPLFTLLSLLSSLFLSPPPPPYTFMFHPPSIHAYPPPFSGLWSICDGAQAKSEAQALRRLDVVSSPLPSFGPDGGNDALKCWLWCLFESVKNITTALMGSVDAACVLLAFKLPYFILRVGLFLLISRSASTIRLNILESMFLLC